MKFLATENENFPNERGDLKLIDEAVIQALIDAAAIGLLDDRGNYDASVNTFPAAGGSGAAGAIKKGDIWYISVAGALGGQPVQIGDSVRALVDAPGQTAGNWSILDSGQIPYTPAVEGVSPASLDFADEGILGRKITLKAMDLLDASAIITLPTSDGTLATVIDLDAAVSGKVSKDFTSFDNPEPGAEALFVFYQDGNSQKITLANLVTSVFFGEIYAAVSDVLLKSNNLSDINDPLAARENLGLVSTSNLINSTDKNFVTDQQLANFPTSGIYIPSKSALVNLDANPAISEAQFMRVGNTVTVSGRFTADPTLTATTTGFELSLPVGSDIGDSANVAGVAVCGNIVSMCAQIVGEPANNTAKIIWKSTDVTPQQWSYQYTYRVI